MTNLSPRSHKWAGIILLAGYLLFIILATIGLIKASRQYKNLQATTGKLTTEISQKLELLTAINRNSYTVYIALLNLEAGADTTQQYSLRRAADSLDQLNTEVISRLDSLVSNDQERVIHESFKQARADYQAKRTNYLQLIEHHANTEQLQAALIKVQNAFVLFKQKEQDLETSDHALIKSIANDSIQKFIHLGRSIVFIVRGYVFVSIAFGIIAFILYRRLTSLYRQQTDAVKAIAAAAEQVIGNEKRFRALIENGSEMISMLDKNGKVIYVSPGIEKITGFSVGEVTDVQVSDLLYPEFVETWKAFLSDLLINPGVPIPSVTRFRHKNGGDVWLEGIAINLLDNENVHSIVANYHDITERKNHETELQVTNDRLSFHLENTPLGFIEWDDQLHVKSWSKEAEKIFGWTEKEFIEKDKDGYSQVYLEDQPWVFKISDQLIKGKVERNKVQHRNYTKDGRVIWCEWFNSVLKDKEGRVITIMSLVQDTTERKKGEENLLQSEARLKEAQALAHISNWEIDLLTNINTWSDEFYNIFNLKREDTQPSFEAFLSLIHPEDLSYVKGIIEKAFRAFEPTSFSCRIESRDGSPRYIYTESKFEFDRDRKPIRLYGVLQDITERKQAEESLLQSEAKLKEAQALSHISNWEIDLLTNVNTWSDEFYNIFSIKREDITPSPEAFLSLLHPDDVNSIRKIVEKTFQTFEASSFTSRIKTKDGSTRYIYSEWRFELDKNKNPIRLYGILQDITERKNAEKAEAEILERLKAIFNGTRDAILLADNSGKYVQVNPPAIQMLGYTEEELLSKTIAQIVSPKYSSMDVWSKFIEGGHQIGVIELIRKDGEAIICHYNSTADILPGVHLSILTDITKSQRADASVRESEKKYRYLFENNPMPMLVFDKADLCFLDVNEAALKHYGYTREEFLGMSTLDIRPKDEMEGYKTYLQNSSGDPSHPGIWKHLKKDGSVIDVEIILHDIDFDQKKASLVLVNDVTEKLKTEVEIKFSYQQLKDLTAHLQRIREEERTRIARKIHDDLGQQLTSLKMDASWIGKKIATEDSSIQEKLSTMISHIDESVKTVRLISSELRPGILDDLGLIAALEWQSEEFGKSTGIKSQFHTSLNDLNPEKNLSINIFRVYQESLTNVARHAQATQVETTLEVQDGHIILIINDNGRGFDLDEVKGKKSLGLIGMRERALMFQGVLTIQSEKGKGTIITLKVPLSESDKSES